MICHFYGSILATVVRLDQTLDTDLVIGSAPDLNYPKLSQEHNIDNNDRNREEKGI